MGDHRYRAVNKKLNMGAANPSGENTVVEGAVDGPTEWIIKPTDIEGEYMYGFDHGGDAADVLISEESLQLLSRQQPLPIRVFGTKPSSSK